MAAEGPRRCKLAQLVAHHLRGDEHGHVLTTVVDGDRVPDHVREDGGRARPCADHPLLVLLVHRLDAAHQSRLDERPFLGTTAHYLRFSFPRLRLRTIRRSDSLCFERVRLPRVGTPHGVTGCRPPFDLPSPPPCGWSTGFIAEPRTPGRMPRQRLRPALPPVMLPCSTLPTWPTVARQVISTRRISPEGRRKVACAPSFATSWMPEPAERAIWPPLPGFSSTLWTSVPVGMFSSGSALPGLMSASAPDCTTDPARSPAGARM